MSAPISTLSKLTKSQLARALNDQYINQKKRDGRALKRVLMASAGFAAFKFIMKPETISFSVDD